MHGATEYCSYKKTTNQSQVPGLIYETKELLDADFPKEWTKRKMNSQLCENIVVEKNNSVFVKKA
jgi:hypothetical protein